MPRSDRQHYRHQDAGSEDRSLGLKTAELGAGSPSVLRVGVASLQDSQVPAQGPGKGWRAECVVNNTPLDINSCHQVQNVYLEVC